ncbi:uncharacterized protein LOC129585557 [Paramacrobiotus metropolitanus]|uniref:uncharacterized protein LOC129585557 n=1 Tax=Paramacrobiotus metropolitanus TaxID=2943436 RepID=UPI002445B663|nr:uncharacterized protein LOC129585557 [Paramacrobiotus metropolitanus]
MHDVIDGRPLSIPTEDVRFNTLRMTTLTITDLSEGAELEGPTNIGDSDLDAELIKALDAYPNKSRKNWTDDDLYKEAYITKLTPRMTLDILEKYRYKVIGVLNTDSIIMWTLQQERTSGFVKRKPAVRKPAGVRTLPDGKSGMVKLSKGRKVANTAAAAAKRVNPRVVDSDKSDEENNSDWVGAAAEPSVLQVKGKRSQSASK